MVSFLACVRITVICAIKAIDTIIDIVRCVRMNDVDNNLDSEAMRRVNQVLEIVRCALARGSGEVARYMVAKGAIVRVLLNSHKLHTVVACLGNPWQHLISKLSVLCNSSVH